MLWVAVDDTDSRAGGCTTWLARRIVEAFPDRALASPPRLVRLNPAVPWKTRGNGALAMAFTGTPDVEDAARRLERVVEAHARLDGDETRPGWAAAPAPLDPAFYARAVREIVPLDAAVDALRDAGAAWGGRKGARGLIGCAGALSWGGARSDDRSSDLSKAGQMTGHLHAPTWEWIGYRAPARWGTPRDVDAASVAALESRFPATFDSYDERHADLVMVPSSPCPVLWGVRATSATAAARAAATVRGERPVESTLFLTNHASDDHLRADAAPLSEGSSWALRVRATGEPAARGGHVFVPAEARDGEVLLAAYAPTRSFRSVLASLAPGDELLACGQVTRGRTINVEKVRIDALAPRRREAAKPACAGCGRAMKSGGTGAAWRCRRCGARAPRVVEAAPAPISAGWHEVPACARRHLARPLKLLRK